MIAIRAAGLFCLSFALIEGADLSSGPAPGDALPKAKARMFSGDVKDQTLDLASLVGEQSGVVVLMDASRWDRRMFRFLRALEEKVGEADRVVAVWLTSDVDWAKEYLPKISSYFQRTMLSVFEQDDDGRRDWGVNPDAALTAVTAKKKKVLKSFGYRVVDESDAAEVAETLKSR